MAIFAAIAADLLMRRKAGEPFGRLPTAFDWYAHLLPGEGRSFFVAGAHSFPKLVKTRCWQNMNFEKWAPEKKKDQLALVQSPDQFFCDRPDPDDPGGLGAEESGSERTGPTQVILFAIQHGAQ